MDDEQNQNAGNPTAGDSTPVEGGASQNPAAVAGVPDGNAGQQPIQGADELSQAKAEIRRLNRAMASKSSSINRPSSTPQAGADGESPFETPQGQYAISLQLATAKLSSKLESVFSLYPEVPAEEISRIRRNPWAYVSNPDLYYNGSWEQAAEDLEYYLLDRAEALKGAQAPVNGQGGALPVNPVVVKPNPPSDPGGQPAAPGTSQDVNPWTMPLDQLEKKKNEQIQRMKVVKK